VISIGNWKKTPVVVKRFFSITNREDFDCEVMVHRTVIGLFTTTTLFVTGVSGKRKLV
jgi:hypothetical protein